MTELRTEFATVTIHSGVVVTATQDQLYAWSHRSGAAWPCSYLDDCDEVAAHFDRNGDLVDLLTVVDGRQDDVDIPADELNAWSSDALRDVLPRDHTAWYGTVGQFDQQ